MKFTYSAEEISRSGTVEASGMSRMLPNGNRDLQQAESSVDSLLHGSVLRLVIVVLSSVVALYFLTGSAVGQMLTGTLVMVAQAAIIELVLGGIRRRRQRAQGPSERCSDGRQRDFLMWGIGIFFWAAGMLLLSLHWRLLVN